MLLSYAHLLTNDTNLLVGNSVLVLNLKSQHSLVVQCLTNSILVQTRAEHALSSPRQISLPGPHIFLKNRRTSEAVPQ